MKNERLDELEAAAAAAVEALPERLLVGVGGVLYESSAADDPLDPLALIEAVGSARRLLVELHQALHEEPRRRSPRSNDDGGHES